MDEIFLTCSVCGRKTYVPSEKGKRCNITQPSGVSCQGIFNSIDTQEEIGVPHKWEDILGESHCLCKPKLLQAEAEGKVVLNPQIFGCQHEFMLEEQFPANTGNTCQRRWRCRKCLEIRMTND